MKPDDKRRQNLNKGRTGIPNKFTSFKSDLISAYRKAGGEKYLLEAFEDRRLKGDMLKLMGRLLPQEMLVKGDIKTTVQFVTKKEDSE